MLWNWLCQGARRIRKKIFPGEIIDIFYIDPSYRKELEKGLDKNEVQ